MSALALGIWDDLRRRKLLPVALLLLVAAVALPLVALKPAEEPVAPPAAVTSNAANQSVDGLPSPEQALSDKPLVSLAVLDEPSDLGEFESKNPFKPIEQVASTGASEDSSPSAPLAPTGGGDSQTTESNPPQGPTDNGPERFVDPSPEPKTKTQPKTEKKLTYAVDLTIRGPKGLRSYRSVPKLSLLPSADNPLLVFLGVEDAGTKAVFLVDAKLKSIDGEGTCTPTPEQCATLALAPGELHTLANDAGQRWTITISEVRETSVAKAAAVARAAQKRRARKSTAPVDHRALPRFVPPLITDLFTGGRS